MAHKYLWELPDWPRWRWDRDTLMDPVARISVAQGRLLGRLADVGIAERDATALAALADDALETSAIEGEILVPQSVRSSLERRLGITPDTGGPIDRRADGVVEMLVDATENAYHPLTTQRLFGWHAALFPTGYSGMRKIRVADWRDDSHGPIQVVSGSLDRLTVHFQAPPANQLATEMETFLDWVNAPCGIPCLVKAGLSHLWFVTLHPFDDGNGRIGRAVADLMLSRCDRDPRRYFSMSAQIQREQSQYYAALEDAQRGNMDATPWLEWFLSVLERAIEHAHAAVDAVHERRNIWQRMAQLPLNERQINVLNRLLEGFEGKMTTRKWALVAKCSPDSALRDISRLLEWGILRKAEGAGPSTHYELVG